MSEAALRRRAKAFTKLHKEPVKWEDYREIIESSEPWDPIQWPENHDWFMIQNVPMDLFKDVSVREIADVEDPGERQEHRERYRYIMEMLKKGEKPWPVIVGENGFIIDGYHRLAAMRTLRRKTVDVLMVLT